MYPFHLSFVVFNSIVFVRKWCLSVVFDYVVVMDSRYTLYRMDFLLFVTAP